MKTLATLIILFSTTLVFAGNDKNISDREKATVINNVTQIVTNQDVVSALGVSGQADVTLAVDEQGVIHVAEVQANNFLLEYHIRQSIEGAKMIVEDSLVGKTINFFMNVVQPNE
ncbi:MAG TPA: hypothetical protein PK511_15180 [Chitinophagales bacterium]|nr:hypothetical protein [Chitinophagales bacterium]HMX04509.1 hypothetical protein [Chitinophagales bacterium]HMZ90642.1 hypothetical protein [Chitinophagales bacterium]HNA57146.1 hypothetical protein [Chitinophagales bacterium]HNE46737.1 hypothetical protein [Chitinophagales bacterium]